MKNQKTKKQIQNFNYDKKWKKLEEYINAEFEKLKTEKYDNIILTSQNIAKIQLLQNISLKMLDLSFEEYKEIDAMIRIIGC